ncbi:Protein of unknown function [Marinobacter sp. LV10R510-11A]|uniref:DUF262 domain-containing protein n=1 Tax=Marinobacter sp. LV10R510-11A TaxID=1415568 RepID=UPI000BB957D9|nr:DUF262 domain-containing protein [Marinobacter sp. LV10R510-11A]SOB75310.1 Protein of unknown function [Marinobacter sp. LV10R510-11A]
MKELIFSLKDVFNAETSSGCLSQYEASCYHIPAYQRGYKWSSEPGGPVPVLLADLLSAFEKKESEYYLQYITVKRKRLEKNGNEISCLEVIDGQQRLTTLSILLSVISARLNQATVERSNPTTGKLHYAVRENFFDKNIYPSKRVLELADLSWDKLISDFPELDRQDIFYLHGALRECDEFREFHLEEAESLKAFDNYIKESVKVIVNSVEPHIESETVFRNLNSNKVPLTEVELIKGLLITRAGRKRVDNADSHFREVMEVRLGLGKDWEHIQSWARRSDICRFYFGEADDGMHQLLTLCAMVLQDTSSPSFLQNKPGNPLFDFFNQRNDASHAFEALISAQQRLSDFFQNNDFYRRIGFCRFVKNSRGTGLSFLKACLEHPTKTALRVWLDGRVLSKLGVKKDELAAVESLRYGEDDERIHAVLLALSVFPGGDHSGRFNFEVFYKEDWSLEHVFPQTPEGKGKVLSENQKDNIRQLLLESSSSEFISEDVEEVLRLKERDTDQRKVYENALEATDCINKIGNICLLARKDNSALGNGFFHEKRQAILRGIQAGSFVPKHTFDVFSKMIGGLTDDLESWTARDIAVHSRHIGNSLRAITEREEL